MGLLDNMFDPQDPKKAGMLNAAFALLGQQGYGNAGMAGLQAAMNFRREQDQRRRGGIQDQLLQGQLGQMQRQQADEESHRSAIQRSLVNPTLPSTMDNRDVGGPGETPLMRSFDQRRYAEELAASGSPMALQAFQSLQPKPADYKVVGQNLVRVGPEGVSEAYRAPQAPEKEPEQIRQLKAIYGDGTPAYQAALQRLGGKMTTHAPAASVNVNTGQKGFDNTLKLRGDFRSEPIYKAHQEMQSAYAQIKQSLKQASPAGDLAGATKIMKLLDPGSVVRESELGMAMAATGLLDRAQNYASMVMNGTKLTPAQRADFQKLADALYSESVNQYGAKRGEYKGIVDRNQLNEADVLGAEPKAPAAASGIDDLVNKYRSK